MGPLSQKVEVQVRSFEMNRRAEIGVAAHWIYKDNIDVKDGKQFRWIRQILDILDFSKNQKIF